MRVFIAFACLASIALADLYIQAGIMGSNNRLDEANRDRANGNRCFDSQNNNRGGYNVGKLTFYEGETVKIGWSNQHSSGKYQMEHTEFVIQGMCETQVRDGTSTRTPPDAPSQCLNFDCDNDVRYCRHESYWWYQMCKATKRNYGLFTANQNLNGGRRATRNTRQNPAGTRRGYECPEERDYYPYWRPTQFFDIAYLNADNARCVEVQANSHNVRDYGYCAYNQEYFRNTLNGRGNNIGELPNTQAECDASTLSFQNAAGSRVKRFSWVNVPMKNISAPACPGAVATSRVNHHGLVQNTNEYMTYEWAIPNTQNPATPEKDRNFFASLLSNPNDASSPDKNCILRMRYNITTKDYPAWASGSSIAPGADSRNNTKRPNNAAPNADQDPAWIRIWETYQLTFNDVWCNWDRNPNSDQQTYCRGYIFRNNPRVDAFGLNLGGLNTNTTSPQFQLAINTNQFGRTFQDRSHAFLLMARPATGFQGEAIDSTLPIYSIQCRGKRGNIVQVYPATEYFIYPEGGQLVGAKYPEGGVFHAQCMGSNTNPNNNDGQGKAGTDRSNICPMANGVVTGARADPGGFRSYCAQPGTICMGDGARLYPARLTNEPYASTLAWVGPMQNMYANIRNVFEASKTGISYEFWREMCMMRHWIQNQDYGNMEELDDAGADWNMPLKKFGAALEANGGANEVRTTTISTRNNNFSNRSQKSAFVVSAQSAITTAMVSQSGGTIAAADGTGGLVVVPAGASTGAMPVSVSSNERACSMTVDFDTTLLSAGGWIQLLIPCEPQALHQAVVEKQNGGNWDVVSTTPEKGFTLGKYMTVVSITSPGTYRVMYELSAGAVVAVIAGCFCFACAFGVALAKKCMS